MKTGYFDSIHIKFVKKAGQWCRTSFKFKDGQYAQEQRWFDTELQARNFQENI